MALRDFLAFMLVCLFWGLNFVVAKFAVTGDPGWVPGFNGVPPVAFAFLRFALLAALLFPFLRPWPKQWPALIGVALGMGAAQYAFIFIGLQTATPSAMALVLQSGVPMVTILSVVWLKERIGWVRGGATVLAILGVVLVVANPAEMTLSVGLLYGLAAAFVASVAMILIRRIDMKPMRLQAWIGVLSAPALLAGTALFETGQVEAVASGGWMFLAALVFTVVLVNIYGHGVFYFVLQKYETTLVAPLTLMAPLIGVVSGILITGDQFGPTLVVGGMLTLIGAGIVASRPNRELPKAPLAREEAL
ncbi:DMT family transporter [Hyphobacterium sp.]|uniref:DMT family transporter n=1 Tax=Hyphobacterium sp. TaxID=2004662 RepID=UPI003BA8F63A